jgi:hypothetical protein
MPTFYCHPAPIDQNWIEVEAPSAGAAAIIAATQTRTGDRWIVAAGLPEGGPPSFDIKETRSYSIREDDPPF